MRIGPLSSLPGATLLSTISGYAQSGGSPAIAGMQSAPSTTNEASLLIIVSLLATPRAF